MHSSETENLSNFELVCTIMAPIFYLDDDALKTTVKWVNVMLMKCKDTGFILAMLGCFKMDGESDSCNCPIYGACV